MAILLCPSVGEVLFSFYDNSERSPKMDQKQTLLCGFVDQARDLIVEAEKTIWENPELGFEEWKTHAYLKAEFEKLGYSVEYSRAYHDDGYNRGYHNKYRISW
jgi:hypothetical protein